MEAIEETPQELLKLPVEKVFAHLVKNYKAQNVYIDQLEAKLKEYKKQLNLATQHIENLEAGDASIKREAKKELSKEKTYNSLKEQIRDLNAKNRNLKQTNQRLITESLQAKYEKKRK